MPPMAQQCHDASEAKVLVPAAPQVEE
jgi:hypothetical protein